MLGNPAFTIFGPFLLFLNISPTSLSKVVELNKADYDFIYISSFRKNWFSKAEWSRAKASDLLVIRICWKHNGKPATSRLEGWRCHCWDPGKGEADRRAPSTCWSWWWKVNFLNTFVIVSFESKFVVGSVNEDQGPRFTFFPETLSYFIEPWEEFKWFHGSAPRFLTYGWSPLVRLSQAIHSPKP